MVINKSGHLFVGVTLMIIGFLFLLDTMKIVDTGEIISRGLASAHSRGRVDQTDTRRLC